MAEETAKPNADRLREYRESNLDSLKQELFSEAPIYDDLETALLADSLSMYLERKRIWADELAQQGAGRQVAPSSGPPSWSAARNWPTWPCGGNWPRAASRPSRPRTIR